MRSKRRYEIWTGVKGDDKHGGIYLTSMKRMKIDYFW